MPNQILSTGSVNRMRGAYDQNFMMYTTIPVAGAVIREFDLVSGATGPVADSEAPAVTPTAVTAWYSERLAAPFSLTTSSVITIALTDYIVAPDPSAKFRFKLYKVNNTGDVNTEIEIGAVDGGLMDTTQNKNTYTFVLPANVEMARGERFLFRAWVVPTGATFAATTTARFWHATSTAGVNQAVLAVPAGMTFIPAKTTLYLRRDASAVGGNFFQAVTTKSAVASTTGIVNTSAGATQIQWTRTGGGTVLEWISPRLKDHWYFQALGVTGAWTVQAFLTATESNASANVGFRLKLFRWRNGTEVEIFRMDSNAEVTGGAQQFNDYLAAANVVVTPTDLQVDDRIAIRIYAIPVGGAMPAGQTSSLFYDDSGTTILSSVQLVDSPDFKAESDPAEPPTPPQSSMTGMGL